MHVDQPRSDFDLRSLLRIVWRRKVSILLCVIIVMAIQLSVTLQEKPTYGVKTTVLVTSPSGNTGLGTTGDPTRFLANEATLAVGDQFRKQVTNMLHRKVSPTAQASTTDDTITLSLKGQNPAQISKDLNDYSTAYVNLRQQIQKTNIASTESTLQAGIDQASKQLEVLDAQENDLKDQLRQAQQANDTNRSNQLSTQLLSMQSAHANQRTTLQQQQASLRDRLSILGLFSAVASSGGQPQFDIIHLSKPPTQQLSPNPVSDATLAGAAGLLLGLVVAYSREQLEDHVRGRLDLEADYPDIPVLAAIPYDKNNDIEIATAAETKSPVAEAYRKLRTSLEYLSLTRKVGVVQITSSAAGEGKTSVAVNLATAVAQAGQNVILVCADFRIPRAHKYFGIDNHIGMTSVLLGQCSLADALFKTHIPNLYLFPAGPVPTNPSELLDSDLAHEVMTSLANRFDLVVVDTPPVLPVADPLVTATMVDATLIVVRSRQSRRRQVRRTVETLEQLDIPIAGIVLNNESAEEAHAFGYGYGYYGKSYGPIDDQIRMKLNGNKAKGLTEDDGEEDDVDLAAIPEVPPSETPSQQA